MYFLLSQYKSNPIECIKFLNSPAETFYHSKMRFSDSSYENFFKANILTALVDVERTIRGTFDCDIFLKNADAVRLKTMFPNACENIFRVITDEDIIRMGRTLETIRNMNAHSILSPSDFNFFNQNFEFLESHTRFNNDIHYYTDALTIAGYIYIIMNFLRAESIANLLKNDHIFSFISCGEYTKDDGINFVRQINRVNLEISIRKTTGNTVLTSVIGEYVDSNKSYGESVFLKIGSDNYPTFYVEGSMNGKAIFVKRGSLTRVFYEDDFRIEISDNQSFIHFSNQLPPFALVDYLYKKRIYQFTSFEASKISKEFSIISKLNKPKYYIDKNIDVLLLPSSISDFRLLSSIFVDSITRVLLCLENDIYQKIRNTKNTQFSSIGGALKILGIENELVDEVKFLRNFVAHGYILNEYMIHSSEKRQFSISYALGVLNDLLKTLAKNNSNIYRDFSTNVKRMFIDKIVNGKYKKLIVISREILQSYPHYDVDDLILKRNFVKNTFFDLGELEIFKDPFLSSNLVVELKIEGLETSLFLNNSRQDLSRVDEFCSTKFFRVAKKEVRWTTTIIHLQKV